MYYCYVHSGSITITLLPKSFEEYADQQLNIKAWSETWYVVDLSLHF